MPEHKKILITGGAGFIGSAVVRQYVEETKDAVINVDKLTYAGNLDSLAPVLSSSRHSFEQVDICDRAAMNRIFKQYQPDAVMHLAAESHVDRSIHGPAEFIQSNILGTYTLLEAVRAYWNDLKAVAKDRFRFLHVSTDEVYGSLGSDGLFHEDSPYRPNSPYSASKASSDHLVRAWSQTYGLPILITNCSNNYGPYQFPEKLIPLMILNAQEGKPLPVYGQGENIRDWLYVEDHARALRLVLDQGRPGRTYNIGGRCERQNIEVVRAICDILGKRQEASGKRQAVSGKRQAGSAEWEDEGGYASLITFVADRPGHDLRYAIDDTRINEELGWSPQESFESGLEKTVRWYLDNSEWVDRVRSGDYRNWIEVNYGRRLEV